MKKVTSILWGIALIIIGGILWLNAINVTNINIFFDGWYTLFIIVPCFIGLFNDEDKFGNLIGLLAGIIWLLCCQNILNWDMIFKSIVPICLVILGAGLIFKDLIGGELKKEIKKLNKKQNSSEAYSAIFSGSEVKFDNQEFKGTNVNAVFGGVEMDLSNSLIKSDCVINTNAIFGGIDIHVPSYVKVKVKSTPIFGGISNKAEQNVTEDSPTIYINGLCIFGGVEVK